MVQTFKKIGLAVLLTAVTIFSTETASAKKMKLKKHHCTSACSNGNHMYKHGEKGHVCDTSCKPISNSTMELKDHVCTSACKGGKHMYAHGEKGHVCDASCKTMK